MTEEDCRLRDSCAMLTDAGGVGYLRASVGMVDENCMLRLLFPSEAWDTGAACPYDFVGMMPRLVEALARYIQGEPLPPEFDVAAQEQHRIDATRRALAEAARRNVWPVLPEGLKPRERMPWARSVAALFSLGEEMQLSGKRPTVRISW